MQNFEDKCHVSGNDVRNTVKQIALLTEALFIDYRDCQQAFHDLACKDKNKTLCASLRVLVKELDEIIN